MSRVHPQVAAILERAASSLLPPYHEVPPAVARRLYRDTRGPLTPEPPAVESAQLLLVPGPTGPAGPSGPVPVRSYRPKGASKDEVLPSLVYFHGGGWVIGDLESHDQACRALANAARCIVVAVDYRLAPEHKFPAAVDDAIAATRWIADNGKRLGIDAGRLAVGGDSAGGNLAAVVCLDARDRGGPPLVLQLLIYASTDMSMDWPSHTRHADQLPLRHGTMKWFIGHYLRDAKDQADWRASPLRAGSFEKLPPALVVTAAFDPLCDEGEAYAKALRDAKVQVTLERFAGQIHGFLTMGRIVADSDRLIQMAAAALQRAFKTA